MIDYVLEDFDSCSRGIEPRCGHEISFDNSTTQSIHTTAYLTVVIGMTPQNGRHNTGHVPCSRPNIEKAEGGVGPQLEGFEDAAVDMRSRNVQVTLPEGLIRVRTVLFRLKRNCKEQS